MNVPFAFAIVSANENIKVFVKPKENASPFLCYFACAFTAGMIASVITNPLDVIKTRLQVQHQCSCLDEGIPPENCKVPDSAKPAAKNPIEQTETLVEAKYKDFSDVARKIYKAEGVHGFYKGALPRMMIVAPGVAISWGTYELFKSILDN